MAEDKKGFILYADLITAVKKLTLKDRVDKTNNAGELFLHLLEYVNDSHPEPINFIVDLSFEPIKNQLKRDLDKWNEKQGKNSEAGKKSAGKKAWLKWLSENDLTSMSLEDHKNEKGRCYKYKNESYGTHLFYYWGEALTFHEKEITRLENVVTESTPVESVKDILTKSTDTVNVTVTVNDNENVKENVKVKDIIKVYSKEVNDCFEKCVCFFPMHLHPKENTSWLDTIEKLNRIESIPFESIESIVKKTRNDDFWSANFLSLTKLRKKNKDGVMWVIVFNEKIKSNEKTGNTSNGRTANTVSEEYIKRLNDQLLS